MFLKGKEFCTTFKANRSFYIPATFSIGMQGFNILTLKTKAKEAIQANHQFKENVYFPSDPSVVNEGCLGIKKAKTIFKGTC